MTWQDDITIEEKEAIEELKRRTIKDLTPKMLEDESIFYRFLRARDFHMENAEDMLRKHIVWRKEYGIDTILTDFNPPEVVEKYLTINFIGYDKEGSVVSYIDVGAADSTGLLNSVKKLDLLKSNFLTIERDLKRSKEQSDKLGRPVTKIVYIYNLDKLTFAKATNKRTLELMILVSKMYQDNYPERIKRIYVLNASIYFTILFSIIKSVLATAVLEKIQVFGTEDWQQSLLELMDADQLPAFLGGNRTDPDGNPLCKTFITHGQIIPDSYYLKQAKRRFSVLPGVKKLKLAPFAKADLRFEVNEPDSLLEWEFETKSKDIGFGVYFTGQSWSEPKALDLIPKQRIETCFEPETGMCKCEKAGTYTIVFDNSYSWIYPKEIYYRAKIVEPSEGGVDV